MMKRIIPALVAMLGLTLALGKIALAVPPAPFSPYGIVQLNGANVPPNTLITAWCNGNLFGQTTDIYLFNGNTWYYNLDVAGDDPDTPAVDGCLSGETVSFQIDGGWADQTAAWAGTSYQLDLSANRLGNLDVTKVVDWNSVAPDPAQTFEICISGPSHPNGNCQAIGYQGGILSWNGLLPGDYAVVETDPGSAWQVSVTGSPATVPADGSTVTAMVTNTAQPGGGGCYFADVHPDANHGLPNTCDGDVDIADIQRVAGCWNQPVSTACPLGLDLDGSNAIDVGDLLIVAGEWPWPNSP